MSAHEDASGFQGVEVGNYRAYWDADNPNSVVIETDFGSVMVNTTMFGGYVDVITFQDPDYAMEVDVSTDGDTVRRFNPDTDRWERA